MVGMRDVAKSAGGSLSTVSLVVNHAEYVSDDMRKRVTDAMERLNYTPNELARNLFRDRTNLIGVIVPTVRHPFFGEMTAAIQHALAEQGLKVMLCSTADSDKSEADYVDMLRRHMMDGIIMGAHTTHPADYWTSINRPVVAFDRYLGDGIPSVGSDHIQGGQLIAELLLDTGARHVVTVGGPQSQFADWDSTRAGTSGQHESGDGDAETTPGVTTTFPTVRYHLTLQRLMREAGVRCDYVVAGDVADLDAHRRVAHDLFDRYPDVDAIVGSDFVAACCVREALARGKRIPEDVQVIAYDGTPMIHAAGLELTCIRQDTPRLAEQLCQHIVRLCQTSQTNRRAGDAAESSPSATSAPKDVADTDIEATATAVASAEAVASADAAAGSGAGASPTVDDSGARITGSGSGAGEDSQSDDEAEAERRMSAVHRAILDAMTIVPVTLHTAQTTRR